MQKTLAKMLGLKLFDELEPNQYQGQEPTSVTMDIDAWSHRLVSVRYDGQDRTESYSAYNVVRKGDIPKTSLSSQQLQQAAGDEQSLEYWGLYANRSRYWQG
jgi:hypothetical protein